MEKMEIIASVSAIINAEPTQRLKYVNWNEIERSSVAHIEAAEERRITHGY